MIGWWLIIEMFEDVSAMVAVEGPGGEISEQVDF